MLKQLVTLTTTLDKRGRYLDLVKEIGNKAFLPTLPKDFKLVYYDVKSTLLFRIQPGNNKVYNNQSTRKTLPKPILECKESKLIQ